MLGYITLGCRADWDEATPAPASDAETGAQTACA